MGQFNMSSNPLSTLFPKFSSQKDPNYNGVFLMDLNSLLTNTSPMPNYSLLFSLEASPYVARMLITNSLVNGNSSNPISSFVTPRLDSGNNLKRNFSSPKAQRNLEIGLAGLDIINNTFTGIFGEKDVYQGSSGAVTRGMDTAYDTVENAAAMFGPVGLFVSLGMKANKLLGNAANKLGAGTDGMTTTDAILGSSFLLLTPLGLINGIWGKNTDTITKDNLAFEKVGASYGGTNAVVDDALTKSDKKYGLFSNKARKEANREIAEANRLQNVMKGIADEATERFAIADSMTSINNNKYSNRLLGVYNPSTMRFGKNGMSLQILERVKNITSLKNTSSHKNGGTIIELTPIPTEILLVDPRDVPEFLEGGSVLKKSEILDKDTSKITFDTWYRTVPEDRNDMTSYNLRRAFELAPIEELEAWRTSSIDDLKNGKNHLNSVYLNPKTGVYEFMKSKNHPTLKYELEWYNSSDPEAILFRQNYDLDTSGEYYKYIPKNPERFEKGGSINVIPEGALHARKHNMDMEGITKKGIPVVSNNENGKVELQAEIEKEEIIFRLEVTKKLEELLKKYYNTDTSLEEKDKLSLEAGKLLVEEILYNTADNVNLIEKV